MADYEFTTIWHFNTPREKVWDRYDWKVETTKCRMNYLAPIARPVFSWNHNVVMGWGGEGLAKRLQIAVTAALRPNSSKRAA